MKILPKTKEFMTKVNSPQLKSIPNYSKLYTEVCSNQLVKP